jgi:hypothetical protein
MWEKTHTHKESNKGTLHSTYIYLIGIYLLLFNFSTKIKQCIILEGSAIIKRLLVLPYSAASCV